MNRLGQDLDPDPGMDGQDALVDRRRSIGRGQGRPNQFVAGPIDHDRDVAELGLDRVALGRGREVDDQLEGIVAGRLGLLQGQADESQLGIGIGGRGRAR